MVLCLLIILCSGIYGLCVKHILGILIFLQKGIKTIQFNLGKYSSNVGCPLRIYDLEQKGAIQVLVMLSETEEGCNITALRKKVSCSQNAMYTGIQRLFLLGLIREERGKFPRERVFYLTEIGREAAERMVEIERLLAEE